MDFNSPNIKIELIKIKSADSLQPSAALKITITKTQTNETEILFVNLEDLIARKQFNLNENENNSGDSLFSDLYQKLTKRERQVMLMVAVGSTSNEIAKRLFIAANTVKNHRRNIKKKLGLPDAIVYSKFLRWVKANIKSV